MTRQGAGFGEEIRAFFFIYGPSEARKSQT